MVSLMDFALAFEADLIKSTRMKQRLGDSGLGEGHRQSVLKALKLRASFFATANPTANPICLVPSTAKAWGDH